MKPTEDLQQRERDILQLKDEAKKRLRSMGFSAVAKPNREPALPNNIVRLSDRELGHTHQIMVEWEVYAGDRLAYARVNTMLAQYNLELAQFKSYRHLEGGPQIKKQLAQGKKLVREAQLKFKEYKSVELLLESVASRYTRFAQLVSREQSRRQSLNEV